MPNINSDTFTAKFSGTQKDFFVISYLQPPYKNFPTSVNASKGRNITKKFSNRRKNALPRQHREIRGSLMSEQWTTRRRRLAHHETRGRQWTGCPRRRGRASFLRARRNNANPRGTVPITCHSTVTNTTTQTIINIIITITTIIIVVVIVVAGSITVVFVGGRGGVGIWRLRPPQNARDAEGRVLRIADGPQGGLGALESKRIVVHHLAGFVLQQQIVMVMMMMIIWVMIVLRILVMMDDHVRRVVVIAGVRVLAVQVLGLRHHRYLDLGLTGHNRFTTFSMKKSDHSLKKQC